MRIFPLFYIIFNLSNGIQKKRTGYNDKDKYIDKNISQYIKRMIICTLFSTISFEKLDLSLIAEKNTSVLIHLHILKLSYNY